MEIPARQLPKTINPCPIRESLVELRFEPKVPLEVFLGLLYEKLKDEFTNPPQKTNILDIPSIIRDSDKNLKYAPHYQFENNDFLLKTSPRSISIAYKGEYPGWEKFFGFVKKVLIVSKEIDFMDKVSRIGVRYISFFEKLNIFSETKVEIKLFGNILTEEKNILRSEFNLDDFICVLLLSNTASFNQNGTTKQGSSIDIDIIKEENSLNEHSFEDIIDKAHEKGKIIFFGLLKEKFLNTLHPEY
ncbi:MAG: TIGR04255 family protein [Gammaproteobacteria bacterium]|jgi:uncharacterized protein (TIGR04255 family)